jgi:hypothetical protein
MHVKFLNMVPVCRLTEVQCRFITSNSLSDILDSCRSSKIVNTEKRHMEAGGIMTILTNISGKVEPSFQRIRE